VVCLGMSATFHTLSNHSDTVAKWGNKLDYTGIVALIVGSYVPALYYGFFCLPNLMTAYLWVVSDYSRLTPMKLLT
jgi:adiponectin receptor